MNTSKSQKISKNIKNLKIPSISLRSVTERGRPTDTHTHTHTHPNQRTNVPRIKILKNLRNLSVPRGHGCPLHKITHKKDKNISRKLNFVTFQDHRDTSVPFEILGSWYGGKVGPTTLTFFLYLVDRFYKGNLTSQVDNLWSWKGNNLISVTFHHASITSHLKCHGTLWYSSEYTDVMFFRYGRKNGRKP